MAFTALPLTLVIRKLTKSQLITPMAANAMSAIAPMRTIFFIRSSYGLRTYFQALRLSRGPLKGINKYMPNP
jgi:hypothetical protein